MYHTQDVPYAKRALLTASHLRVTAVFRWPRIPFVSALAQVLLDFMLKLLHFTAEESKTLNDFEAGTPFSDPDRVKNGNGVIVSQP